MSSRAQKQAKQDMANMVESQADKNMGGGKDYVGYHASIAANEDTTDAQRRAFNDRHAGEGQVGEQAPARKRIPHTDRGGRAAGRIKD